MSLISPTIRSNPISQTALSEVTIIQIIIGITFSLILVEFWRIFLETLFYTKLGLNRSSAFQTFIVAITLTIILILVISYVKSPVNDLIVGINPSPAVSSRTQALLGGTQPNVSMSTQCACRGCADDTVTDRFNPVAGGCNGGNGCNGNNECNGGNGCYCNREEERDYNDNSNRRRRRDEDNYSEDTSSSSSTSSSSNIWRSIVPDSYPSSYSRRSRDDNNISYLDNSNDDRHLSSNNSSSIYPSRSIASKSKSTIKIKRNK